MPTSLKAAISAFTLARFGAKTSYSYLLFSIWKTVRFNWAAQQTWQYL